MTKRGEGYQKARERMRAERKSVGGTRVARTVSAEDRTLRVPAIDFLASCAYRLPIAQHPRAAAVAAVDALTELTRRSVLGLTVRQLRDALGAFAVNVGVHHVAGEGPAVVIVAERENRFALVIPAGALGELPRT